MLAFERIFEALFQTLLRASEILDHQAFFICARARNVVVENNPCLVLGLSYLSQAFWRTNSVSLRIAVLRFTNGIVAT